MHIRTPRFRPEIEGIRAVAVAAVLAFHFQIPGFQAGFLGVDIFLVVSGYVITAMLEEEKAASGTVDTIRFFTRRARRLLPAMFATIGATLVAGYLLFNDKHFLDLGHSSLASAVGVPNIYFWLNSGYFSIDSDVRPLLHLWSIGVELQVYLIWPLQFLIRSARLRAGLVASVLVVSLAASQYWTGDRDTVFYLAPFRIFEFALGALLVHVRTNVARDRISLFSLAFL